ncbi:hypothetical protein F2P81_022099 [Scophthalmus maximus]|uniref:Testis-expressed sequence 2 protein-like n=1 Tax=Scophthalmus maximus TaxID=52904 RepID=A0A6A4RZ77_SCOMX|nr:hypothetical protein F2P81_022099 [Scophthalmus maximus]
MAESGKNGERRSEDEEKGDGRSLQEPYKHSPVAAPSFGSRRHLPRGIVIQLTGTEGEWDSLDDSELIFSLDHDEDYPSTPLSTLRQLSVEDDRRLQSQAFHVPLSPSSPGSLGNCSATGPSFLSPGPSSPTHRPLASLVKSLSTELELKEGSTLRPKPFLSLVKSISTEISRSEPEVSQSKSDSRLNLHLWKQLTQPKSRSNGDSRTAPPSPSSLSPSGEALKGGFFKMELEDTKRKLSEAVHEPLSNMFSKIMREESAGSPKHQCKIPGAHQVSSRAFGRESSTDTVLSDSPVRNARKPDAEFLPVFDWPSVKSQRRIHHSSCPVHHHGQYNRGREKEEWFRHFLFASVDTESDKERDGQPSDRCVSRSGDPALAQSVCVSGNTPSNRGSSRVGSGDDDAPCTAPLPTCMSAAHVSQTFSSTRNLSLLDYPSYMARLLATEEITPLSSPGAGSTETSPTIRGNCTCDLTEYPSKSQTAWADALIGRILWDFLREKHWADVVSQKIQKKLSKIRVRTLSWRGLWVELQVSYTGALQMTLQTKFNLSKLGKEGGQDADCVTETGSTHCRPVLSVLADSDEESSSAGSSDEEELLLAEPQGPVGEKASTPATEGTGGGRTGRKILRFVDKIAKSKYFQKATENEFIRKKFEEMSNTPLLLTVEVQELSGTLVVNIPPPPTDRIWYSFCVPPKLELHVRPKLGEREVTFCHVTEWIERKLQDEFQKVFVLPNMDDIYLPLMHSGMDQPQAAQHLSPQSRHSCSSSTESIERIPPPGQSPKGPGPQES